MVCTETVREQPSACQSGDPHKPSSACCDPVPTLYKTQQYPYVIDFSLQERTLRTIGCDRCKLITRKRETMATRTKIVDNGPSSDTSRPADADLRSGKRSVELAQILAAVLAADIEHRCLPLGSPGREAARRKRDTLFARLGPLQQGVLRLAAGEVSRLGLPG